MRNVIYSIWVMTLKKISFDELLTKQIFVSDLVALCQVWIKKHPKWSYTTPRPDNGLIYFCGKAHYTGGFDVGDGDVLYIPKGCKYSACFEIPDGESVYDYLINFNLHDESFDEVTFGDKIIRFSPQSPSVLSDFKRIVQNAKDIRYAKNKLNATLTKLLCNLAAEQKPQKSTSACSEALDYILENCYDSTLTVEAVARQTGMSDANLRRLFLQCYGCSPKEYINSLRLYKARELLTTGMSVSEVAFECGFSDPSYFIRFFKKQTGTTPRRVSLSKG